MANFGDITSNSQANLATVIFDHYADAGNSGTSETDLYSDTLAASQLASNGEKIAAFYAGVLVASETASRRIRAYFGGTAIYDSAAFLTLNAATWRLQVDVIRESSTVVRVVVSASASASASSVDSTLAESVTYTRITGLTLTNTQILKITGEATGTGAATNDIVAKMGSVTYAKAA